LKEKLLLVIWALLSLLAYLYFGFWLWVDRTFRTQTPEQHEAGMTMVWAYMLLVPAAWIILTVGFMKLRRRRQVVGSADAQVHS
jgi:hypothetical protein